VSGSSYAKQVAGTVVGNGYGIVVFRSVVCSPPDYHEPGLALGLWSRVVSCGPCVTQCVRNYAERVPFLWFSLCSRVWGILCPFGGGLCMLPLVGFVLAA